MTTTPLPAPSSSKNSVKRRLTRDLTLLVLFLIALFLLLAYFYSKQIQREITIGILNAAQNQVITKNNRIFEPISNNLTLSKKWAQLEFLSSDKHDVFNKRFIPILETLPQISSVILADSNGREYLLSSKGDHWLSRQIDFQQFGNNMANYSLWDSNNKLIKNWQEEITYKSSERPWYQLAMTTSQDTPIKWSSPYSFYTLQTPGVTGVTRWQGEKKVTYILAFDVTLSDIARSLSSIRVGNNDISFLLSPNGEVILPPGNTHIVKGSSQSGSLYAPGNDSSNYAIFDSVTNWVNKQKILDKPDSFSRNGNRWWYKIFPLDKYNSTIYAGVLVPEKKLYDVLSENFLFILFGIFILLLIAVVLANVLVKKYAHQLKDVPKTSLGHEDFANEIYELIRLGESETLEFKSTMRKNLKSGKPGKEIEIAWLKGIVGFMNTHGGILLIGIEDDGNILGIEADEFDNEDKILLHFKNLLSQHIGLEFSNYINLIINQMEGKTILVIECERADRPAFLYNKNSEDFYIRSGPASVKLSVSKVLNYVRNRY